MSSIKPYAGFWKRAVASIIDGIVISIPMIILFGCVIAYFASSAGGIEGLQQASEIDLSLQTRIRQCMAIWQLVLLVGPTLYFTIMESSKLQASLGKMVLGIKVVDANGQRLTFWRSLGRNAGKFVSNWTFNIGYLMAGATRKKQALHDKMASAYVVDKDFQPGDPMPDVQTHFGILWAVVGLTLLSIFLFIALFVGMIVYGVQHAGEGKTSALTTPSVSIQQIV